jgi:rod shape-determining protein MreD
MRAVHFSLPIFLLSVLLASVLDLLRLPTELMAFRPHFVTLVLIYWLLFVPTRVGVCAAWLLGLWVDALQGDVLGVHATVFALLSYGVYLLHRRLRVFPMWQQAAVMGFLLVLERIMTSTLLDLIGRSVTASFTYYWPALTSALVWPLCVNVLNRWRRV